MASDPKIAPAAGNGRKYNPTQPWQIADSLELYHVSAWGKGYFSINEAGHVVVRPDTAAGKEIDLYDVVEGLKARDLTSPVVVRFSGILAHRLRHLHGAFAQAIAENDYKNRYAAVFPIKVNQQRLVVEEVYRYGQEFKFGLEAGSKPELLAVMAMTENTSDRLIICNGFKDDSYIEAVILATKLGRTIIPVVENFDELGLILKHAQTYGVRPRIGVRVKLFSEGSGRWRDSAGEKSKFGLFVTEILELFNILKSHDMLDCLQLVHCHPGSQLQDIRRVKDAINELAHVYAELKLMGAGLQYIDVGGGLGVDYDGSGTNFSSSMNYTLNEYLQHARHRAPHDHQRVRTGDRGLSQCVDFRCAGLFGTRQVSGHRQRGRRVPGQGRVARADPGPGGGIPVRQRAAPAGVLSRCVNRA
jgi:arginine decarboxylase